MELLTPEGWKRGSGYSHGTSAAGRIVFVSGQIGADSSARLAEGLPAQVRAALENVAAVLGAAGAQVDDVARFTWFVTDKREYIRLRAEIGAAYRAVMGAHFPAMSVVEVSGLIEDGALVEIEATAVVPA